MRPNQASSFAAFCMESKPTKQNVCLWLLFFAYAIATTWLSSWHSVSRDEMRALSLVQESRSIGDFFHYLHIEGHPALWYVLLYAFYSVLKTNVALKVASLVVAFASAAVFLWKSPFSLLQKAMFLAGVFPIYMYSVMSRNYGVSMLLLFIFCALYANRFKHLPAIGVVMFLLAQTNAHSAMIAICILGSLLAEYCYRAHCDELRDCNWKAAIFGFGIMAVGIVLMAVQTYPAADRIAYDTHRLFVVGGIVKSVCFVLIHPGWYFCKGFGIPVASVTSIVLWLLFIVYIRKPFILLILAGGVMGVAMIFAVIHGDNGMRHQGLAYMLVIAAFWMDLSETGNGNACPKTIAFRCKQAMLYFFLTLQIAMACVCIWQVWKNPYSESAALAKFVEQHKEFHDAIIVTEPDFVADAFSYYVTNPTYIPRERRFGAFWSLSTASQKTMSLDELLDLGRQLKVQYKKPVLIVLQYQLLPNAKKFAISASFGRQFVYDSLSLQRLGRETNRLVDLRRASKNVSGDEEYTVYELR